SSASSPATASSHALAAAPSSAATSPHALTALTTRAHAGMSRYGCTSDLLKLATLELLHHVSDATCSLILINIDIGCGEGLHGIGADVSGDKSCCSLPGYLLGSLYASAAGCIDIRVSNGYL